MEVSDRDVRFLEKELRSINAVTRVVEGVPPDELGEPVSLWMHDLKELSYSIEDVLDAITVRREGLEQPANPDCSQPKRLMGKINKLFNRRSRGTRTPCQIAAAIEDIKSTVRKVAERRPRCTIDASTRKPVVSANSLRPSAPYQGMIEPVGIDVPVDEITSLLTQGYDLAEQRPKILSIVGIGGLGKTTLAQAVYDRIKVQFDCGAFVSVSMKDDTINILKNMLYQLRKEYTNIHAAVGLEVRQLINELREFLEDKRYLIVIDDIWDEEVWEIISLAFSHNRLGNVVITTTRMHSVARACSLSSGFIYQLKPLSDENSRRLFNKKVFLHDNECPDKFKEVSAYILKKCSGMPLLIVMIAGLLASNDQHTTDRWYRVLYSIGRRLEPSLEECGSILSLCYYDLPSHLKTCLLYLSIFPDNHEVRRDRLIWRWISEGFVQGGKQESSLFEVGESYFNELLNRNMIQPVGIDGEGRVKAWRVHSLVLDFIYALSIKENFVTILHGQHVESATHSMQSKVRRLSLQNCTVELTSEFASSSMSQVRSVTLFHQAIEMMPSFSCFQVLRVLDLEGCDLRGTCNEPNIRCVGTLLQLRYLGLRGTHVGGELPMEIGKLHFLQTLDIKQSGIENLPLSILQLRHLMCLNVDYSTRLQNGLRNLTSLEELSGLIVDRDSLVKDLGHLTKLRVLKFWCKKLDESSNKVLVESLGNLCKIQSLHIDTFSQSDLMLLEGWVPPPNLRRFLSSSFFLKLPKWISSSSLPLLSCLEIRVNEMRVEDIQIIGMLPALCSLFLQSDNDLIEEHTVERFMVTSDTFPFARKCSFWISGVVPCMFSLGAMPRLQELQFRARAVDIASGNLDLGMGHLPSLKRVEVKLCCEKASSAEVDAAVAALKHAAHTHPNCPTIRIN